MKILVLGMGNPILCDDAVGIRLARDFKKRLQVLASASASPAVAFPAVDVIEDCPVGGLNLLDLAAGYDRLIVFDSIATPDGTAGAWYAMTGTSYRETMNLTNVHDANFTVALELGRRIGTHLPAPDNIYIFAVEIADNTTFSETMTPQLEASYPHYSHEIIARAIGLLDLQPAGGISRPTNNRGDSTR